MERKINGALDHAAGFIGTTDQDRYDECEEAVHQVLRDIRQTSHELKVFLSISALVPVLIGQSAQPVLRKTKYYQAIGTSVNAALSRLLADILALPDITEAESHKLSELCRILNALEGLFAEDPSQASKVGNVAHSHTDNTPVAFVRRRVRTSLAEILIPFGASGKYSTLWYQDISHR